MKTEELDGLIKGIVDIDGRLSRVEVKGDSVEFLLASRMLLKQLTTEIEKLKLKYEDKEKLEKEG